MNFNKFAELGDLKFEKAKKVFQLANEAKDIAKLNAKIEQQVLFGRYLPEKNLYNFCMFFVIQCTSALCVNY